MKKYQNLIGMLAIAAAIIIAGSMISGAIENMNIGAQIAGALSNIAAQIT